MYINVCVRNKCIVFLVEFINKKIINIEKFLNPKYLIKLIE